MLPRRRALMFLGVRFTSPYERFDIVHTSPGLPTHETQGTETSLVRAIRATPFCYGRPRALLAAVVMYSKHRTEY